MRRLSLVIGLVLAAALTGLLSLGARVDAQSDDDGGVFGAPRFFGCGGLLGSDDDHEDNDTRPTASAVSLPFDESGLMSCDDDWYSFSLPAAKSEVHVDAYFEHDGGDIDISLFDSSGAFLTGSASVTDNESLSYTVATSGTYYVRVVTFEPPLFYKGNDYRLRILACLEDSLENNDTSGAASAVSLSYDQSGLRSCPGDEDWYSFSLNAKSTVNVDAFFTDASGNIDISLHNPSGDVVASSTTTTDNESITYLAPAAGTYRVRVDFFGNIPIHGNLYRLRIVTCQEDSLENNDTTGAASGVTLPFSQDGLGSCPGDDDWFSFPLTEGKEVQIDALFVDADGDVDVYLRDPTNALVGSSTSQTDNEKITHTATMGGTYTVGVQLFGGVPPEGNTYILQISATQPEPTNTPLPTSTATPEKPPGDVNDDGLISSVDAALILQLGAGLVGSLPNEPSGDVNGDGDVTSVDAALILQCVAGLISCTF
ncbi:MAG: pre-peptidase C-terminal domain-containing protein [Dehalococcoidia bacterium]|nr:pre-peptidase C-terminal domain-containing protein [Dehalococcoidia bacterium]